MRWFLQRFRLCRLASSSTRSRGNIPVKLGATFYSTNVPTSIPAPAPSSRMLKVFDTPQKEWGKEAVNIIFLFLPNKKRRTVAGSSRPCTIPYPYINSFLPRRIIRSHYHTGRVPFSFALISLSTHIGANLKINEIFCLNFIYKKCEFSRNEYSNKVRWILHVLFG